MGWFWDDGPIRGAPPSHASLPSTAQPPPSCPMHNSTSKPSSARVFLQQQTEALPKSPNADPSPPPGCPMHTSSSSNSLPSALTSTAAPAETPSKTQRPSKSSTLAALNPLNYMPSDLSQSREFKTQTMDLPVDREMSSIPRGDEAGGNWVYPSPQQMYNAMLRKGHTDTPQDAVESMVAVHNFLNEGAWAEIVEWERRFSRGLWTGWQKSAFGEEGSLHGAMIAPDASWGAHQPKLLRFEGNKEKMTPRAYMMQVAGWIYPSAFGGPPPFDRHDWYIERNYGGKKKEVRYVIDYYSAAPEETGEPVFFLDIRPALDGPTAAAERAIRWGRDFWWRASGGRARLAAQGRIEELN